MTRDDLLRRLDSRSEEREWVTARARVPQLLGCSGRAHHAAAVSGASRCTAAFVSAYGAALVPARLRAADLVRARIPWAAVEAALLGGAA